MSADELAKTAADPSMDDILASIRRILTEEEVATDPKSKSPVSHHSAGDVAEVDDVFSLDETMLITPPPAIEAASPDTAAFEMDATPEPPFAIQPETTMADDPLPQAVVTPPPRFLAIPDTESLIATEAEDAAVVSMGELVRSVQAERNSAVYRGGPTIEDVVRAEIRPVLKSWLDAHLPKMVERLVRSEIERVVGRAQG